jgi:putative tryptophan/tyrosine transport system substrate-binding protein
MSSNYSFSLQQRLSELGHVEGQTIVTERRLIPGAGEQDRLDALAVELVKVPVALIVAMGSAAALAAKRATTTIPIVRVGSADPVGLGASAEPSDVLGDHQET